MTDSGRWGAPPTEAELDRVYDVCVVGSGASGSLTAWLLTRAGLSVAIIEQGGHVTEDVSYDDLLAEAEAAWVRQENGTWGKIGYPWTTCNVGGGTVFFGGAFFRNRPVDFDAETVLGKAELPLTWPWDASELGPYYSAVEHLVGVAGLAGADPTLPEPSTRYPLPPVTRSAEGELLAEGAEALGWTPFPTPLAINTRAYRGQPECAGDAPCICRACPAGAKGDARRFIDPAVRLGARLFAGLKAVRLETGSSRTATELRCVRMDTGVTYRIRAERFVLCANAVQTAALLLRSTSDRYPTGLGNTRDMVGRGLCFKLSEYVVGYRYAGAPDGPSPADSVVMGLGPFSTCAVADLYRDPAAPGGIGGLLYEARPERPYRLRASEQIVRIEALVPDEPQPANRVRLGTGTDAHGVPDVVMDYQAHPRDLARLEYLAENATRALTAAGCSVTVREPSGWQLGSCHLHGTCRMGDDPTTSVTDGNGRLHDTDNVYVGDGAVLPFPGGANPTLTIQAVALRTAHRLLRDVYGIAVELDTLMDGALDLGLQRSPR